MKDTFFCRGRDFVMCDLRVSEEIIVSGIFSIGFGIIFICKTSIQQLNCQNIQHKYKIDYIMQTLAMESLKRENRQLHTSLKETNAFMAEQQKEIVGLRLRIQKLEQPPTSPTSIIRVNSSKEGSSESDLLYLSPLKAATAPSSREAVAVSLLPSPTVGDMAESPSPEILQQVVNMKWTEQRLSSITMSDNILEKGGKETPRVPSRRTTPSPSTPVVQAQYEPLPSREERDQRGATIQTFSNAVKGLPRESSIANHSDADITVYPPPEQETKKVQDYKMIDGLNERGIYTGFIDTTKHLPHGFGTMKYRMGREYTGEFVHGHWNGQGTLKNKLGDVYKGNFVTDKKEGFGVLKFSDGRLYKGRFQNDHMREGKLIYNDMGYYNGLFQGGKRHGFGKYVFAEGSHYEGQWKQDKMHGRGTLEWTDGSWYNGEWYHGIQQGHGTEAFSDGSIRHSGRWHNGNPVYKAEETMRVQR